jgi:hypothetical protein
MKILTIVMRVLLGLLLLMPILGSLGVFPAPTADLYSPGGWAFMSAMMGTGYLMWLIALTCAAALVLTIMNRMALAAAILSPLVVNIVCFHLFLEGGLLTASASLADILLALTAYFLWMNRGAYVALYNYNKKR